MRIELRPQRALSLVMAALCAGVAVWASRFDPKFAIWPGVAALAVVVPAFRRPTVLIDDAGITARRLFAVRHRPWSEVTHYRYYWSYFPNRNARLLGGRVTTERLSIVASGGEFVAIDGRYTDIAGRLDQVFAELHARLRPSFYPFELTETELANEDKSLALTDIERVDVSGAQIAVFRRGSAMPFSSVPTRGVKNSMRFVEALLDRGVVVAIHRWLHVPAAVMDKQDAANQRRAAVPQARVVTKRNA